MSRINALEHERAWIDREINTWNGIASHSRGLIEYYERRMRTSHELLPDAVGASASPARKGSPERFGSLVKPIADRMIAERGGAVRVEEIYAALPPDLRTELDSASSTYSTPFRLRRMFRRDKRYAVSDVGIAIAGMKDALPDNGTAQRVIRRSDGSIAWFEIVAPSGETLHVKAAHLRNALRNGRKVLLPSIDGHQSQLRLAGNKFFAECNGRENNDYARLPQIQETDVTT